MSALAASVTSSVMRRAASRCCTRLQLDVDDLAEVGLGQRAEADDLVDPVDELGLEERQRVTREVRRHDEHGVGEVDRAALTVGEAAVVQHLQQHVEDVGVGLLDLVEQHHAVRAGAAPPR